MSAEDLTLSLYEAAGIREALLIGLTSLGVIEECLNGHKAAELFGHPFPKESRPLHPTGCADTISKFATALTFLDMAERAARGLEQTGTRHG